MKIISKVLSTRIKNVLPLLIYSSQKAHVKNRFISVSGRVISNILEISNSLALEGFLITVDTEKAFDSVNHCFVLHILRKFQFGIDFVGWIKTIVKGAKTRKYFKRRSTRRSNFCVFFFILVLEMLFIFAKNNPKV